MQNSRQVRSTRWQQKRRSRRRTPKQYYRDNNNNSDINCTQDQQKALRNSKLTLSRVVVFVCMYLYLPRSQNFVIEFWVLLSLSLSFTWVLGSWALFWQNPDLSLAFGIYLRGKPSQYPFVFVYHFFVQGRNPKSHTPFLVALKQVFSSS